LTQFTDGHVPNKFFIKIFIPCEQKGMKKDTRRINWKRLTLLIKKYKFFGTLRSEFSPLVKIE
jgi:hypothetical protein